MAVQTVNYLKEKFNNLKTPNGQDFSDLIDSCHNLSVSGLSGIGVFSSTSASIPPANTSTVAYWINVTFDNQIYKMPLYL